MKRKYIVPLILASVSATTLGAHAQFSVKADYDASTTLAGDMIQISGFKGEGVIGEKITLPVGTLTGGAKAKVTVLDPRGQVVATTLESGKDTFVPTLKGYYSVKYSAVVDGKVTTVTDELKILVQGDDYSISLPSNSKYVVPATVKTNTKIQIPMPTVKCNDVEKAQDSVIATEDKRGLKVSVYNKDNASATTQLTLNSETNTFDYTPTKAGVYEIVYRYYDNSGFVQDYKTDSFTVKDNFDSSSIKLNFSYKSTKPTTAVLGVKTSLPQVKAFDESTTDKSEIDAYVDIKVKHEKSGKEYTVTDYSFVPQESGAYLVTYQVSIPLFGITTKTNTFRIADVKDNQNPSVKVVNNYSYTTTNGVTVIDKVYNDVNRNNTYDAGDIELYNKDNYTNLTDDERLEKIATAMSSTEYNIPSVVYLSTDGTGAAKATVKLPAIYSVDNYSDFSKLTLTRSVKTSTGLITEVKKSNADGTKTAYPANEWAEYTFTAEGDYSIRYEAKDENGNSYMSSYSITVKANDAALKEDGNFVLPTVDFPAITSYSKNNATLTFTKPSATDKYDTRVETRVYYSFSKDSFDTANEATTVNSDGKMELDLSSVSGIASQSKIYIHAVAYNDYANNGTDRLYSKVTREITLINTTDNNAPTMTNIDDFFTSLATKNGKTTIDNKGMITVHVNGVDKQQAAFDQKELIKLPSIKIEDAEDTNLSISLEVRDPNGQKVTVKNSVYNKTVSRDSSGNITNNIYTIENGSFTADYSGVYTVTYTAKDAGGNIVAKTIGIRVRDTEKPDIVLSSYDPFTSAVEVGKFIEVPAATLTDKGVTLTDITTNVPYANRVAGKAGTYWELVEGPSLSTMGTVGFTPTVAGDYVIKYYGWDAEGNYTETKKYTITATDTIKPTIKLENDYVLSDVTWDESKPVVVYAPGVLELYDGYRDSKNPANDFDQTNVSDITLTVKVYDKNNNIVEGVVATDHKVVSVNGVDTNEYFVIGEDAYGNQITVTRYQFTAKEQGVYTIKYIATDGAGNSTEISKEVKVGDTVAPEVEWVDSENNLITTANVGDSFEFNLDMIELDSIKGSTAIEVPDGQDKAEYTVTVNMYDSSSSLVTNQYRNDTTKKNSYKWDFEKSGTYELRIVAQDKAGNKITKSYNIVVSAEDSNKESVKPVVGTVLIVVSALILVGVVTYFVVTGRKKSVSKKAPKAKK